MEMEVWVGEMRSDEPGSAGGGDAGVGGCECQWVESAVGGWWLRWKFGGQVVPASTHIFSTRQNDDLDLKQVVSGGAELRCRLNLRIQRVPPCHIRKTLQVIHLIFRKDTDQKPPQ